MLIQLNCDIVHYTSCYFLLVSLSLNSIKYYVVIIIFYIFILFVEWCHCGSGGWGFCCFFFAFRWNWYVSSCTRSWGKIRVAGNHRKLRLSNAPMNNNRQINCSRASTTRKMFTCYLSWTQPFRSKSVPTVIRAEVTAIWFLAHSRFLPRWKWLPRKTKRKLRKTVHK